MTARRPVLGLLVALGAGAALAAVALREPAAAAAPWDAAAFCAPVQAAAHVRSDEPADLDVRAVVPLTETAAPLGAAVRVAKDAVVRITVWSPRPGGVAVHGLLAPQPVGADGTVVAAFRTLHSGRFPLHFHGADGSHQEIAACEVLQRDTRH